MNNKSGTEGTEFDIDWIAVGYNIWLCSAIACDGRLYIHPLYRNSNWRTYARRFGARHFWWFISFERAAIGNLSLQIVNFHSYSCILPCSLLCLRGGKRNRLFEEEINKMETWHRGWSALRFATVKNGQYMPERYSVCVFKCKCR